jgi:hypothetical protein
MTTDGGICERSAVSVRIPRLGIAAARHGFAFAEWFRGYGIGGVRLGESPA